MKKFASGNKYYGEVPALGNTEIPGTDPNPSIKELPSGEYVGRWYGYTFELENGKKYRTIYGVRNSRSFAKLERYRIDNDGLVSKSFSGMTEVGGALQGRSYGKPIKPLEASEITRLSIDTDGFKIPEKVKSAYKLDSGMGQRRFSMNDSRGNFIDKSPSAPIIGINKDNSIIRGDRTSTGYSQSVADKVQPENKMTNVFLDWGRDAAFHLAVEPWITAPLASDTQDGIYLGSIKGSKVDTGKTVIDLLVNVPVDYPQSVILLVKNRKAFIFKQSQLAASTGSKIFSITKIFSEVKSDDDFRSYAHNLMKEAHKDNYSEETTNKVVDDLLSKHTGSDYGELIGRLKSGLGNKKFSEEGQGQVETIQGPAQRDAKPKEGGQAAEARQDTTQPVQDAQSQQTAQAGDKPEGQQDQSIQQEVERKAQEREEELNRATNELAQDLAVQAVKQKIEAQKAVLNSDEAKYTFEFQPTAPKLEMQAVVGTLLFTVPFCQLFDLCTVNDYPVHQALDEYRSKMPELIDKLATNYLSMTKAANFQICVVPQSMDPARYLTEVQEFVTEYQAKMITGELEVLNKILSDILSLINTTLYKLKRLSNGKKVFSFCDEENRTYSERSVYLSRKDSKSIADSITSSVMSYTKKFKKSPLKDKSLKSEPQIKRYVKDRLISGKAISELVKEILLGASDDLTSNLK